jgi:hypothetical protein
VEELEVEEAGLKRRRWWIVLEANLGAGDKITIYTDITATSPDVICQGLWARGPGALARSTGERQKTADSVDIVSRTLSTEASAALQASPSAHR